MKPRIVLPSSIMVFLLYALPVQAETVLIAAASNVQFAFDELINYFHQKHSKINLKISFGSSGNFYGQIAHGAPYDIFFSADLGYPQKLEAAGLAAPDNRTIPYALGKIVLWAPNDAGINLNANKFLALAGPKTKKVAIANPRHAPYGRAALESMKHFLVYEKVKNKLVMGENISQTAQFADSGSAQAAILSLSLVLGGKMRTPGTFWKIPEQSHQPIAQGFLILKNGKNPQTATTFAKFILGSKGRNILKRHGYKVPVKYRVPEEKHP